MSSIHTEGWAIIGSVATALWSIAGNVYLARKSRSQVIEQAANQFKQAAASLDVQRTVTARTAATFIADKRQAWINDLRDDVSLYSALTVEILEGWKRVFSRLGNRLDEYGPPSAPRELEVYNEDVRKFAEGIAERDSLHVQLLTRIMLRLNGEEVTHRELVEGLYRVRASLRVIGINANNHEYASQTFYDSIDHQLQLAQIYTKAILKEEWQKLKREVAAPERLIARILATSPPDDAEIEAFVQKTAPSVPSSFSSDPDRANARRHDTGGTPSA
uniref:Uncharacterized protein n=1 Tax=Burkholderia sp. Ha185 TaxID=1562173 RepID=A0A0R5RMR7_9BURK|nr:hypothetical protein [Burkholderia sp. Ha185]